MARETLKAYLSSLGAAGNSITYTVDDDSGDGSLGVGDDLGVDPGTQKELLGLREPIQGKDGTDGRSPDDTGLIGDYLRYILDHYTEAANYFKLEAGNREAASINRGSSISPAEIQGAENVFIPVADPSSEMGNMLSQYSNSGKFDETDHTLLEIIDKTQGVQGNELLPEIEGSNINTSGQVQVDTSADKATDATESVSEILTAYNRFQPGTTGRAFAPRQTSSSELDESDFIYPQTEYGEYERGPEEGVTSSPLLSSIDPTSLDKFKEVAHSLLLKAAGFDTSATPGDSIDPDEYDYGGQEYTETQEKRKVELSALRARNAYNFPDRGGISVRAGAGDFLTLDESNTTSYGTTNTPESPFDPIDPAILAAQAAAALVALGEVASDLNDDILSSLVEADRIPLGRGPLLNGVFSSEVPANIRLLKSVIFVPTDWPFEDCVNRGLQMLFGDTFTSISKVSTSNQSAMEDATLVQDSPGYLLAICRSILRSANTIEDRLAEASNTDFSTGSLLVLMKTIQGSKIVGFFKMLATIGNASLQAGMGQSFDQSMANDGFFNVDNLPDSPSTRMAKSRSDTGFTNMALAWRGNVLPSAYLVPKGVINAAMDMGTLGNGPNPLKALTTTTLNDKAYLDANMSGESSRIPGDVVERLENLLDSEYSPFYFHDLRTNEIVAFHAFLSSLSDTYSPRWNGVEGYGRMDNVQIYKQTTRSISLSFIVAATSQEDFDEMWFKVNKLVTMVYPQWSKGMQVLTTDGAMTFTQPFSQVLKSSPVIRLRVGDLVKGNYSKFNLARLFGVGTGASGLKGADDSSLISGTAVGDAVESASSFMSSVTDSINNTLTDLFFLLYGTPLGWGILEDTGTSADRALRAGVSQLLTNGFANPALTALVGGMMRDPDTVINPSPTSSTISGLLDSFGSYLGNEVAESLYGYHTGTTVFIKPSAAGYYTFIEGGSKYRVRFSRPVRGTVLGQETRDVDTAFSDPSGSGVLGIGQTAPSSGRTSKTVYSIMITDLGAPTWALLNTLEVTHSDLILDPNFLFNLCILPMLDLGGVVDALVDAVTNEAAVAAGIPADTMDMTMSDTANFMSSYSNPVVKAFNSSRGRGLAGVITRLDFRWVDSQTVWETDWNSRAPKMAKVTLGFTPIHDITPGIDHEGFNRAPIYNVGRAMEYISGDPYDDHGLASKYGFRNDGRSTWRSKRNNEED